MLALTLHAQGRSAEALPWFELASATRGGAVLWSNQAAALLAVGRVADAASIARRATESDRRHAGAWLNLGLASELQHNFGEAIATLKMALSLAPGSLVALRALVRCHLQITEYAAALAALAALPVGKDIAADLLRCEAWIGAGELAKASPLLERLTKTDDRAKKEALLLQGKIAADQGRSDQEFDLLRRVLKLDPDSRQAIIRTALLYINGADIDAGLKLLRDWLDVHPQDQLAANNYLIACGYSERFDGAALLAEHRRLQPVPTPAEPWPRGWSGKTGKGLRIGWVASAFSVGVRSRFSSPMRLRAFGEIAPEIEHVLYAIGGESGASGDQNRGRGTSATSVGSAIASSARSDSRRRQRYRRRHGRSRGRQPSLSRGRTRSAGPGGLARRVLF